MQDAQKILENLGLSLRETKLYLTLLELGPTAIRKIAAKAEINRGTTYELLKKLQQIGLVSYYHQGKQQHFVAEDPKILTTLLERKKTELETAGSDLKKIIPELSSLTQGNNKPVVKFYENYSGIRSILEDVLDSVGKLSKKEYAAYSSSTISPYLYHKGAFPDFTHERIKRKVHVRTISIGPGGSVHGQDERKWLTQKEGAPTYTLIYTGKVAMISVGKNDIPHGLIIEDSEIYKTQLMLFNSLWNSL